MILSLKLFTSNFWTYEHPESPRLKQRKSNDFTHCHNNKEQPDLNLNSHFNEHSLSLLWEQNKE